MRMRIIAGELRGRTLRGPRGSSIRPTADRVREALFNILAPCLPGARVLDLFSGTGAISLEAISRGASSALLADSGREALQLARANADALGAGAKIRLLPLHIDASVSAKVSPFAPFDVAFADPPYADVTPEELLTWLSPALLSPDGVFVIEHSRKVDSPEAHGGFVRTDSRRFGDTALSFYRSSSASALSPMRCL